MSTTIKQAIEGFLLSCKVEGKSNGTIDCYSDKLKGFLLKQQPFVLLFDETLEYIAKALDATSIEGNLGGQTYAFLQELTETVASIENGMLIVTLPSSELEDYTPEIEQGLARLMKIFGRVETITTPVRDEEIYSIIKKRLLKD